MVNDNYLDNAYHVPYAHKALGANLDLESYSATIHDSFSIQAREAYMRVCLCVYDTARSCWCAHGRCIVHNTIHSNPPTHSPALAPPTATCAWGRPPFMPTYVFLPYL